MKKSIIFITALSFLLFGCKKAEELTQFNIDYTTEVTIPSSSGLNLPFDVFTPDMETNSSSKFAVNDTRKDKVEVISLTKLQLVLKTPSNSDFGFLKSIEVYIDADGLSEKRVAFDTDIPSTIGKILNLEVVSDNLKDYIIKDEFSLRVKTVTDEAISRDHVIDINSTFFVDAKIL